MNTQVTEETRPLIWVEKGDLAYWSNASIDSEQTRVKAQIRLAHLAKYGGTSPDTEEFLTLSQATENFADGQLAKLIVEHPTWPWASRIKGLGKENYPKAIGQIEKFGKFYDVEDPLIPVYVHRRLQTYLTVVKGEPEEKTGVFVKGIERLTNPSKLHKYSGLDVDNKTGKAARRIKGQALGFNTDLKMLLVGRLATSLMMARGVWYSDGYCQIHEELVTKAQAKGKKIIPTPKERTCPECGITVTAKDTKYCPECGSKLVLKNEPEGVLFLGHLHRMAIREMMKRFEVCLWLVWREALGLPLTQPYSVKFLNHKPIDPWKMVDSQ